MKKNVLVFGSISGLIITALMVISTMLCYKSSNFEGSMLIGYASMLIAFSFIFVGIKNYRDKYNNGVITFGKAFKVGLFIALISSTFYVVTWLIEYYAFMPDFMEKYSEHVLNQAKTSGASAAELAKQTAEMEGYKEMYKNPIFVILLTYSEVFPLGIVISLIAAAILRKKEKPGVLA
ncbi:MAG: DUF4199 domain-containing protein [Bacteroidota bacterium]|nr:DUF4199 domain-containing protein [Bacteroidota bacterium]